MEEKEKIEKFLDQYSLALWDDMVKPALLSGENVELHFFWGSDQMVFHQVEHLCQGLVEDRRPLRWMAIFWNSQKTLAEDIYI